MFTNVGMNIDKNPCKRSSKCRYCPLIDKSGILRSISNGRKFHSRQHVNCQILNLIYVFTCDHCGIQYVGQTKNRILKRFQGHIFDISHDTDTTMARHFNRCPTETPSLHKGMKISLATFISSLPDTREGQL